MTEQCRIADVTPAPNGYPLSPYWISIAFKNGVNKRREIVRKNVNIVAKHGEDWSTN